MNNEERVCGIFTLSGVRNESQVKIKHISNSSLKKQEYIADTMVERFDIIESVYGEIYQCNITDTYLMISKKLPIMYVNIICEKPLRRILLYKVFLYFTIKTEVKSPEELLKNNLDGSFNLEISIEDSTRQLDDTILKYPGDEKIYTKLKNFARADEMKEIVNGLLDEINRKLEEEYIKEFEQYKIPTKIISLKDYYTK